MTDGLYIVGAAEIRKKKCLANKNQPNKQAQKLGQKGMVNHSCENA